MSIYKIAKECGVSPATVSRVINGRSDVSSSTREMILSAMEKHNFKPQISKNTNNSICLFVSNTGENEKNFTSPYISKLINGITYELFGQGYMLSVLPLSHAPNKKSEFNLFCRKHRIAGGIYANLSFDNRSLKVISEELPSVCIGLDTETEWIKTVSSKNYEGAYEAVSYLVKMGHKRIMSLCGKTALPDHKYRLDGYMKALEDNGIEVDRGLIFEHMLFSATDFRIHITNIMSDPERRPTAIFASDDFEVIRLMSLLDELRIRIPQDISVIGFDDYDFSRFISPPLTTVRQQVFELGISSARIILDILNGTDPRDIENVILDTNLVIRNSVQAI